jgi:hypothetical protein
MIVEALSQVDAARHRVHLALPSCSKAHCEQRTILFVVRTPIPAARKTDRGSLGRGTGRPGLRPVRPEPLYESPQMDNVGEAAKALTGSSRPSRETRRSAALRARHLEAGHHRRVVRRHVLLSFAGIVPHRG